MWWHRSYTHEADPLWPALIEPLQILKPLLLYIPWLTRLWLFFMFKNFWLISCLSFLELAVPSACKAFSTIFTCSTPFHHLSICSNVNSFRFSLSALPTFPHHSVTVLCFIFFMPNRIIWITSCMHLLVHCLSHPLKFRLQESHATFMRSIHIYGTLTQINKLCYLC